MSGVAAHPEILTTGALNFTTSATPGTETTDTPVAAPGAGFRLRIYGVSVWPGVSPPAGTIYMKFGSNVTALGGAAFNGVSGSAQANIPPAGVPLPANTAYSLRPIGSVASMPYRAAVLYATESV